MDILINGEYVRDTYDELKEATRSHFTIAHENAKIESALKSEKAYALANKIIEGSNADKRDAAWHEHYKGHLILFEILKDSEAKAKLRLELARIQVEELRLTVRLSEGGLMYESLAHDDEILRDLGLD
jgi:hypothetical protein